MYAFLLDFFQIYDYKSQPGTQKYRMLACLPIKFNFPLFQISISHFHSPQTLNYFSSTLSLLDDAFAICFKD